MKTGQSQLRIIVAAGLLIAALATTARADYTWTGLTDMAYVSAGTGVDTRGTRLSQPRGGVYVGSHFWVSSAEGFNRLDPDPAGVKMRQLSTNAGVAVGVTLGGQPAFDPERNVVYVPDRNRRGRGVYKVTIAADTDEVIAAHPLLTSANLGGRRPSAVALGPDGQLYVGFESGGDIVRVENPSASEGTALVAKTVARTVQVLDTRLTYALAFWGEDLYVAQNGGLSVIRAARACQGGCRAAMTPASTPSDHYAVVNAGAALAVATTSGMGFYAPETADAPAIEDLDYTGFFEASSATPYVFGRDFGFIWAPTLQVPAHQTTTRLFVLDDAAAGAIPNYGRITHWSPTPPIPPPPPIASITVTPGEATAHVGDTLRYVAVARDHQGVELPGITFTWESSDAAVAVIDSAGVAVGLASGYAAITASSADVTSPPAALLVSAFASITMNPSQETVRVGETLQYVAVARDDQGVELPGITFTWESSDAAVAVVDSAGVAVGLAPGYAAITASSAAITSPPAALLVSALALGASAALPPWEVVYGDVAPFAGRPANVFYVCPAAVPACVPTRSGRIIPTLDGRPLHSIFFLVNMPEGATIRLASGAGNVIGNFFVTSQSAPSILLFSDLDVTLSYYDVKPVWGATTTLPFESTVLTSDTLTTTFYREESYETGSAAIDFHQQAHQVIADERAITGITSEPVRAFVMPTEIAAVSGGEGNFSFGNGTVTINYGNPPVIAFYGGVLNTALPRFAHENTHELFDEVRSAFLGNNQCLNEGIADALAWVSGYLPEPEFGPVGVRGVSFDANCVAISEIHDVGNCYFWHVKKAGLLTESFMRGIFHPAHIFNFNSCTQNTLQTGNSVLVMFTEAAGGADVVPILNSMGIPHSGSYVAARQALGL